LTYANDCYTTYERVFIGETKGYYLAKAETTLGDVYVEKKDYEKAETHYHRA